MKTLPKYSEYPGVTGRPPVACVVSVGRKARQGDLKSDGKQMPIGTPIDKNAFYIMSYNPTLQDQFGNPMRDYHPAFEAFNSKPTADRTIVRGVLVGNQRTDCAQQFVGSYAMPDGNKCTDAGWWCRGDGKQATRYDRADQTRKQIKCPDELCEFRLGEKPACKLHGRLMFMLRLDGCPPLLAEWDSSAWSSGAALKGMFDHVESVFAGMDRQARFFGILFQMEVGIVSKKSASGQPRKYPTVKFSVEGNVIQQANAELQHVTELRKALPAPVTVVPIGDGPADAEEATRELLQPGPYAPANVRANAPDPVESASPPVAPQPAKTADDKISRAEFDALNKLWTEHGGDLDSLKVWLKKKGFKQSQDITRGQLAALMAAAGGGV